MPHTLLTLHHSIKHPYITATSIFQFPSSPIISLPRNHHQHNNPPSFSIIPSPLYTTCNSRRRIQISSLSAFHSLVDEIKWKMQMEEVEAILEKIWDLHDKLSDAIHSVSRSHFLASVKTVTNSSQTINDAVATETTLDGAGFVFVKDFRPRDEDADDAVNEAKSLNAIRTALENLEDQLEFFHTIQTQQRVERDAAIARLEQSRIVLAMRPAEHAVLPEAS
ncbi:unnamed protein product [Vicia faba]|uniref:Uncharacterized protein n=1 Tax=Vicia faba TaxID=3906 RepID=A0AAV1AYB4_VICFA|nr:unnamed protein product [Vicia faba]